MITIGYAAAKLYRGEGKSGEGEAIKSYREGKKEDYVLVWTVRGARWMDESMDGREGRDTGTPEGIE